MQKFGTEPPNWVTGVTGFLWFRLWLHSNHSSSHSHHLHKSFQKDLSALVLLKSELCLLRDQHSLSGTHTAVPADPTDETQRTRWPLFSSPSGFQTHWSPLSSWDTFKCCWQWPNPARAEQAQVNSAGRTKMFTMHNIEGWFALQPLAPCTSPSCCGKCHPLVKVKMKYYKHSPRVVHHSLSAAPLYSTVHHLLIFQHKKPG